TSLRFTRSSRGTMISPLRSQGPGAEWLAGQAPRARSARAGSCGPRWRFGPIIPYFGFCRDRLSIVADGQPVVAHGETGERFDVDRVPDRPHAAVAQDELTDPRVVTAEPLLGPVVVGGRGGQRTIDGARNLPAGEPGQGEGVVVVVNRSVPLRFF